MKSGEPFRKVIIVVWVRDKVAQSRDDSGGREPLTDLRCIWREPLGLAYVGAGAGKGREGKNQ